MPATLAMKNLFDTNGDDSPLNENNAERFHSVVAKLLFICKRGRPDIEPGVAYLCTRASCAKSRDMRKLH